ncbi:MAG TPA: NADH-quinone oxidoreductase subunit C [Thermoplasmata archaeon]|nr:NADH-quinone oxidoreductase subunit C [Thermoplasmata archaeon]
MTEPALKPDAVQDALGDLGTVETVRWNRVKVSTKIEKVREAILRAQSLLACDHVVQISAVDNGKSFELIYHLTGPHRMVIALAIDIPRDKPEVPTTSDILPPAGIYERQIHDLLGIVFRGHPDLRRIILNEDWPANEFPLRKDWKMDPNKFYGGVPPEVK